MGRGLTRVQTKRSVTRRPPEFRRKEERNTVQIQPELELVGDCGQGDAGLNYKELPITKEALAKVLGKDAQTASLRVQRLRDYFNPILQANHGTEDKYRSFILALMHLYLERKDK